MLVVTMEEDGQNESMATPVAVEFPDGSTENITFWGVPRTGETVRSAYPGSKEYIIDRVIHEIDFETKQLSSISCILKEKPIQRSRNRM